MPTKSMPKTKTTKKKESVRDTKVVLKVEVKDVVCGHEEVTHPENCHAGTIQDCDLLYLSCGEHGEHYQKQCQQRCV